MDRPLRYILDAHGEPEPCDDLLKWAEGFRPEHRRVAYTEFDGGYVSTVFLGLDHAWDCGPPILWETMIFGGPHDQDQWRYRSRADAERGHAYAVRLVTNRLLPTDDSYE